MNVRKWFANIFIVWNESLSYIEYLADYLTFADEEEGFEVVKSMKETGYLEDLKYLSGPRDEEDTYEEAA